MPQILLRLTEKEMQLLEKNRMNDSCENMTIQKYIRKIILDYEEIPVKNVQKLCHEISFLKYAILANLSDAQKQELEKNFYLHTHNILD